MSSSITMIRTPKGVLVSGLKKEVDVIIESIPSKYRPKLVSYDVATLIVTFSFSLAAALAAGLKVPEVIDLKKIAMAKKKTESTLSPKIVDSSISLGSSSETIIDSKQETKSILPNVSNNIVASIVTTAEMGGTPLVWRMLKATGITPDARLQKEVETDPLLLRIFLIDAFRGATIQQRTDMMTQFHTEAVAPELVAPELVAPELVAPELVSSPRSVTEGDKSGDSKSMELKPTEDSKTSSPTLEMITARLMKRAEDGGIPYSWSMISITEPSIDPQVKTSIGNDKIRMSLLVLDTIRKSSLRQCLDMALLPR